MLSPFIHCWHNLFWKGPTVSGHIWRENEKHLAELSNIKTPDGENIYIYIYIFRLSFFQWFILGSEKKNPDFSRLFCAVFDHGAVLVSGVELNFL